MRHVTDDERRARLAVRHALAPAARVGSPVEVVRAMTVLHATEPATVPLACWARVDGLAVADVDDALYAERSLVKQLAMRRTLWVFPRDLLPAAWGSASARVAAAERARLAKDVVAAGVTDDGDAWLEQARALVLDLLAEHPDGLPARDLRELVPHLDVRLDPAGGAGWAAGRVLTVLGLDADVVRGTNDGHWRTSRPRWTLARHWLGPADPPAPLPAPEGYAELVRRWLRTFGPGTEADLVWWLGATKGAVRAALAAVGAVPVTLDGGGTGFLLPDDLAEVAEPAPWAALLPVLDPTVMGWRDRSWYLGDLGPHLFDRNGNAGTTAWVDGRVVGCWTQDDDGTVAVHLVDPGAVGDDARAALDAEAARLTRWLDGLRIGTVYPSPLMRSARDGAGSPRAEPSGRH